MLRLCAAAARSRVQQWCVAQLNVPVAVAPGCDTLLTGTHLVLSSFCDVYDLAVLCSRYGGIVEAQLRYWPHVPPITSERRFC